MKRILLLRFSFVVIAVLSFVVIVSAFPTRVLAQDSTDQAQDRQEAPNPRSRFFTIDDINNANENYNKTGALNSTAWETNNLLDKLGGTSYLMLGNGTSQEGAVSSLGKAIAFMIEHPPASSQEYIADLFQHSPFVPQAYAQGIGFKGLSPVLPIWKAFRDLSYVFFVIIFVVIGFLIMFRQKLNGQTVVTVTNALPNLVVTLILITFSYAIAGFIIDVMYLSIYFIVGVFNGILNEPTLIIGSRSTTYPLINIALSNSIFLNGLGLIFGDGGGASGGESVVSSAASAIGYMVKGFFKGFGVGKIISGLIGGSADILMQLVLSIAIFFAVVKTFFELLKSYVSFIISVIFSPFELLITSFSSGSSFGQWFKNMIGHLAPFPVVIVMIFLAMAFGGYGKGDIGFKGDQPGGFQPPQITMYTEDSVNAIQGLVALGILMLIPSAVEIARDAVGAKKGWVEQHLPKIAENLKKGWTGGELIEGFGPKVPGAAAILGGKRLDKGAPGWIQGGVPGYGKSAVTTGTDIYHRTVSTGSQQTAQAPVISPTARPPSGAPSEEVRESAGELP